MRTGSGCARTPSVSDTTSGNRRNDRHQDRRADPQLFFDAVRALRSEEGHVDRKGRKKVDLAVYYHPPHTNNIQRMVDAMKASLDLFSEKFSPYQFHQARILEFPAYESFAEAFAGRSRIRKASASSRTTRTRRTTRRSTW
jgi:hypothetical protein